MNDIIPLKAEDSISKKIHLVQVYKQLIKDKVGYLVETTCGERFHSNKLIISKGLSKTCSKCIKIYNKGNKV